MQNQRMSTVGKVGFWVFVPVMVSAIIGFLVSRLFSWFDYRAVTMLIYALFTLWVIGRYSAGYVRVPLTIVNIILFAASGYVQWDKLRPETWPLWSNWIAPVVVTAIWVTVFIAFISYRRKLSMVSEGGSAVTTTPVSSTGFADGEELLHKVQSGEITVDVKEQLLSILRLAGSQGDLTFNAADIMRQLGLQSVANDRNSRIAAAQSIMEAVRMGIYGDEDMPLIQKVIRKLHEIPDLEPDVAYGGAAYGDDVQNSYPQIVWD